jgi:hypothetical protein
MESLRTVLYMTERTIRKSWRKIFQESEFHRELQTEILNLNRNTREISMSAQGRYITGLALTFYLNLNAAGAENPIPGTKVLDICVDDLRIKGPKNFLETFCVSPGVLRHLHRAFLDKDIEEFVPVFVAQPNDTAISRVIVPVLLDQKKGYYSLIVDAALGNIATLYAADITINNCTMTINVISTDTPPQYEFSIQSQSLLLPVAGRSNITTLYQGYYRESLSILGEWAYYVPASTNDAFPGAPNFDTVEYQLPSGRTIITADMEQIRFVWFMKSQVHRDGDGAQPVCQDLERFGTGIDLATSQIRGETLIDVSYMGLLGREPWNDSGLFSLQTVANVGTSKQPDIMEVLLKGIIPEGTIITGDAGGAGGISPPLLPGGNSGGLPSESGIRDVTKSGGGKASGRY